MAQSKFHIFELGEGTYYLISKLEFDALNTATVATNKIQITQEHPPTFGKLLHLFRKANLLSFEDLASESGVGVRTLKDQENNGTKPQKISLDKLCEFFGAEFEDQLPNDLKDLRKKTKRVA